MSDQTVSGAIARQVPLEPVLEQMRPEFAKLLPAQIGAERFERWAVTFLKARLADKDPKQVEAWRQVLTSGAGQASLMSAFLDCASLGLEPGRTYHLVPFGGTVTGITDYKGEIQLITNAERCSVVAMLVREKDVFAMRGANVPPLHERDWFDPEQAAAPVVGGYAYVAYEHERCSLVATMTEAGFLKHREKARTKAVWDEWPEPMRLKTLVHQVRKFVGWSPERLWTP